MPSPRNNSREVNTFKDNSLIKLLVKLYRIRIKALLDLKA
jgi:hypothetical protein